MRTIEITTKIGCVNACVYCPQGRIVAAYAKVSSVTMMSFEVFKACLGKVPKDVLIVFAGMCEPWLNPECTDMVVYAHKHGYKVLVHTTLVNMRPNDVDVLSNCSFRLFDVHLP